MSETSWLLSNEDEVDIGDTCQVQASQSAFLSTGQSAFWCCVMWGSENVRVPDGSLVEVIDVDSINPNMVVVRVLKSGNPAVENAVGSMKSFWLTKYDPPEQDSFLHQFRIKLFPHQKHHQIVSNVNEDEEMKSEDEETEPVPVDKKITIERENKSPNSSTMTSPRATDQQKEMLSPLSPPSHSVLSLPNSPSFGPLPPPQSNNKLVYLSSQSKKNQKKNKPTLGGPLISVKSMQSVIDLFSSHTVGYSAMYPLFLDGKPRVMPGEVVVALSDFVEHKAFEKMSFLRPLKDAIAEVSSNGCDQLICKFKEAGLTVSTPESDKYVLKSGLEDDPYLVHPKNKPKIITCVKRSFMFKEQMVLKVNREGVISVEQNQVYLKEFFKFNANIRTVHNKPQVEYDSSGYPYLRITAEGKPYIENNHYCPMKYEDWIVLTVLGKDYWIGFPALTRLDSDEWLCDVL